MKNSYYFLFISIFFFIGIIFYYFFREATIVHAWFGIENYPIDLELIKYFNWFPSFVHVITFSILTWIILDKKYDNAVILFWVVFNLVSEYFQGHDLGDLKFLPDFLINFYKYSTFSYSDMIAILVSALILKVVFSLDKKYIKAKG